MESNSSDRDTESNPVQSRALNVELQVTVSLKDDLVIRTTQTYLNLPNSIKLGILKITINSMTLGCKLSEMCFYLYSIR